MQVPEFRKLFVSALEGQPGIRSVEDYPVPEDSHGLTDTVVHCTDGVSVRYRLVRTSPPGGEQNASDAVREPGTTIQVVRP